MKNNHKQSKIKKLMILLLLLVVGLACGQALADIVIATVISVGG